MKAPKPITEARAADILAILLDGAQSWDLCEYVREQEKKGDSCWFLAEDKKPLSYSQIRRYAARAESMIRDSCRASRKKIFRRHMAQSRNLYAKAVSAGDVRAALSCLNYEAQLTGLLFDDQVIRRLEALEAQQAAKPGVHSNGALNGKH
jgi:hypothetical protein